MNQDEGIIIPLSKGDWARIAAEWEIMDNPQKIDVSCANCGDMLTNFTITGIQAFGWAKVDDDWFCRTCIIKAIKD